MPGTGDRTDPFRGYNFRVEIDGITQAGFREVSGLDATSDPIEYREGNEKVFTHRKLPGQVKYSNITLKWGITSAHEFWDWRKQVIDGKTQRKNGSIVMMNESGDEKIRWNFVNAWPSKWSGPSFNAMNNEVAVESVELQHEGVGLAS
ncbi:MAG: phage tail protein [Acidobacteriia bacterium]|nr:phage tail protein [Terriglobia bacterium]